MGVETEPDGLVRNICVNLASALVRRCAPTKLRLVLWIPLQGSRRCLSMREAPLRLMLREAQQEQQATPSLDFNSLARYGRDIEVRGLCSVPDER